MGPAASSSDKRRSGKLRRSKTEADSAADLRNDSSNRSHALSSAARRRNGKLHRSRIADAGSSNDKRRSSRRSRIPVAAVNSAVEASRAAIMAMGAGEDAEGQVQNQELAESSEKTRPKRNGLSISRGRFYF